MKIGIIGTGMVGQTLGAKLAELGHAVMIGTRDVARTLARTEPDAMGNPPYGAWAKQHPRIKLGTFAEAAAHGEVVINAASGGASIEALKMAGEANLRGKILMDVANPLDFSKGMPPTLSVCNSDSLGEQIQRAFPQAKVVKTLNTVNASLMVNPRALADGNHDLFVSGNDAEAKTQVAQYLKTWFGWKHVIDLGDITTARGAEMLLPIWLRLWGVFKTPTFNYKIVK
jgi:predicted dinucleotide-binding enzyme